MSQAIPFPTEEANKKAERLLTAERHKASFDVARLSAIIYGSQAYFEKRCQVMQWAAKDPAFDKSSLHFLDRPALYRAFLRRAAEAMSKTVEWGLEMDLAQDFFLSLGGEVPIALHQAMFIPTIESQGTPQQRRKWLPLARMFNIIGCYAQTEMGHGSNVQGLETTAHLDLSTDEFVLSTPSITALKWWPGGLGKTATHAIVHARLLVGKRDYGIAAFIVPLRDGNHQPLPGIIVGDIGPKFGYTSQDNGYLGFQSVRIPRENMLMRFIRVDADGTVTRAPREFSKAGYLTMILIRARLVRDAYRALAKACTIAIRYGCVRTQFAAKEGQDELQILEYPVQQARLFPLLATAYAFLFTGQYMRKLHDRLAENLKQRDANLLPEVHATSAGLKALTTWITSAGIEEARKCCGGHGYHRLAGFYTLYVDYLPTCTYEGDNVILSLQTARYIVKQTSLAQTGQPMVGALEYLTDGTIESPLNIRKTADILHPDVLRLLYAQRANKMAFYATKKYHKLLHEGCSPLEAQNKLQVLWVRLSRAHTLYTVIKYFQESIECNEYNECNERNEYGKYNKHDEGNESHGGEGNKPRELGERVGDNLRGVLLNLYRIFALHYFQEDLGEFVGWGCLTSATAQEITATHLPVAMDYLYAQIRPEAVSLVDAFGFCDWELDSALGRERGDVYEQLWLGSQRAPINQPHNDAHYMADLTSILDGRMILKGLEKRGKAKL
jgi:acyl-CoA oxidase